VVYHIVLFGRIAVVRLALVRDALNLCKDNKMGER